MENSNVARSPTATRSGPVTFISSTAGVGAGTAGVGDGLDGLAGGAGDEPRMPAMGGTGWPAVAPIWARPWFPNRFPAQRVERPIPSS